MKNLIFFLLILNVSLNSQNLINDGGFEDNKPVLTDFFECDYGLHLYSNTWRGFGTCQLFKENECNCSRDYLGTYASAALDSFGLEPIKPKKGKYLASFRLFDDEIEEWREFIYTDLNQKLIKDKLYRISFYVSISATEDYISNNFGIAFSPNILKDTMIENPGYSENPQPFGFYRLPHQDYKGKKFTHLDGWVEIEFYYKANGNEKNLVIGNFKNDLNTEKIKIQDCIACRPGAMIFIDEVYVEECSVNDFRFEKDSYVLCSDAELKFDFSKLTHNIKWSDGDNKKSKTITQSGKYFLTNYDHICAVSDTIEVYKLDKLPKIEDQYLCEDKSFPKTINLNIPYHQNNLIRLNNISISSDQFSINEFGEYLLEVENENCKETIDFKIVNLKNNIKYGPNPVEDKITIERGQSEPIDYLIYDNLGRMVKKGLVESELYIREFASGLYYITFPNSCLENFKFHKK